MGGENNGRKRLLSSSERPWPALDRARVNSWKTTNHRSLLRPRYGIDWVDDFFLLSRDSRHASDSIRLPSTSICLVFWFILPLRVVACIATVDLYQCRLHNCIMSLYGIICSKKFSLKLVVHLYWNISNLVINGNLLTVANRMIHFPENCKNICFLHLFQLQPHTTK